MKNKKNIILVIINIYLFISTLIISIRGCIFGASSGQVGENIIGLNYFKPFTIDSNILLGISGLILSIFIIINKKKELPKVVKNLYYAACVSTSLTFLTVIFFLFPMLWTTISFNQAITLFLEDMFFFHVLNPILAFISFVLIKNDYSFKDNIISIIPMFIYSFVYCFNVITNNWSDFYGFTFGGKYYLIPLVMIIMYLITFFIGLELRKINKKYNEV